MLQIPVAFAHDKALDHYKDLERVLFGRELQGREREGAIKLLEYASALALDQFSTREMTETGKRISGTEKLLFLKTSGVRGIPSKIEEIDFIASAKTHQSYTHRGWDHDYIDDKANWNVRKKLLLATVEHVFDFDFLSGTFLGEVVSRGYDKRCNSFAALVYYVHILGDLVEAKNYKAVQSKLVIPLAQAHPGESNRDIFYELDQHLPIIFREQKNSRTYKSLISDLRELALEARALAGEVGGVNKDEKFEKYHKHIVKTMETLEQYIPRLLQNEEFFTKVFP